jgi:hypothetical protein
MSCKHPCDPPADVQCHVRVPFTITDLENLEDLSAFLEVDDWYFIRTRGRTKSTGRTFGPPT